MCSFKTQYGHHEFFAQENNITNLSQLKDYDSAERWKIIHLSVFLETIRLLRLP